MLLRLFLTVLLLARPALFAAAQAVSPLDRLISIDLRNERIETALDAIGRAGRFSFSYNPAVLAGTPAVTFRAVNQPVRNVLTGLFRDRPVGFKARGNHVILNRQDPPRQPPTHFYLDGYIFDSQSGDRIAQASIYERSTLASTVSNPSGYYRIRLPTAQPTVRLEVRKRLYQGESVLVTHRQSHSLTIRLKPTPPDTGIRPLTVRASIDTTRATLDREPPFRVTPDRVTVAPAPVGALPPDSTTLTASARPLDNVWERGRQQAIRLLLSARQAIHFENLRRDSLYRTWQVSLVPFVGTNMQLSSRVINRFSLNIIAGSALGVNGFEAGGFLNIIQADVNGFQAAGFANVVGRHVSGFQAAGFLNANRGDVQGFQGAGFTNVVRGSMTGFQGAGFSNVVRGDMAHGLQAAGFVNVVNGHVTRVMQVAGFANVARRDVSGFQVAGFTNQALGRLNGWQLSGFLNVARTVVGGRQLGFINVADSSATTPIGFLSVVRRNGYRRLEVSANELTPLTLTFRTGTRQFYNIFTAGLLPNQSLWSYGYGLGTGFALGPTWTLSLEGLFSQLNATNRPVTQANFHYRLAPVLEKRFGSRLALAVGPTLNAYRSYGPDEPLVPGSLPALTLNTRADSRWSGWLGWQAGIRFCNR